MKNYFDVTGYIKLEGSKSILNRVLIIASYLHEPIKIYNPSNCADISTMKDNLKTLGLHINNESESWIITPPKKLKRTGKLFIQDSGTAYRFLVARIAAIQRSKYNINISEQLKRRPIKPLLDILKKIGATISKENDIVTIKGSKLHGGVIDLSADVSSQFISSLLLIAPSYNDDLEIFLEGEIVSRPYIYMTVKIMQDFGVIADFDGSRIFIQKGQEYSDVSDYAIEPDFSSACYFWAIGTLSRSKISTDYRHTSLQPDQGFLNILKKVGANIEIADYKVFVKRDKINSVQENMMNLPDQVPTLAILALFANSKTVISDIEHLQYKESNRIKILVTELSKINAKIFYKDGLLIINPLNKIPGRITLNSYNDHRLVMAFHILKLIFPQISITNTSSVAKSYPNFLYDIKSINSKSL